MNFKPLTQVKTYVNAAALGVGGIGGEIATNKLGDAVFKKPEQAKFKPIIPILLGTILHSALKSESGKNFAKGMVTVGAVNGVKAILPADTKAQLGITGQDPMMGNVMMAATQNHYPSDDSEGLDFMGAEEQINY